MGGGVSIFLHPVGLGSPISEGHPAESGPGLGLNSLRPKKLRALIEPPAVLPTVADDPVRGAASLSTPAHVLIARDISGR